MWSWHWPENPAMSVRFALQAPNVAVAEWFRRLAVNQSTRVRFPPVTPMYARRLTGQGTGLRIQESEFDPSRAYHHLSSDWAGRNDPKVEVRVRLPSIAPKISRLNPTRAGFDSLWTHYVMGSYLNES